MQSKRRHQPPGGLSWVTKKRGAYRCQTKESKWGLPSAEGGRKSGKLEETVKRGTEDGMRARWRCWHRADGSDGFVEYKG